ncbi:MAG: hypothetical protein MJ155_03220 [Candidatus Saccharibacteria bacterium]|nr:hypothetical protein [Candidatus Saccharibacteria bacterium]
MCYVLSGLEDPAINFSVTGTGHFMKNITPDMYSISVVDITGQDLTLGFKPTANVPRECIGDGCSCCTLKIHIHEGLSLIVKEIHGYTVRYLFVSLDEDGDHFVYSLLKKSVDNLEDLELMHTIKPGLAASDLINDGFAVVESGGNGIMPVFFTFT